VTRVSPRCNLPTGGGRQFWLRGESVKLRFAVALGLTTATLVTGVISAALAEGATGKTNALLSGHDCTTLTLTGGHPVRGYAEPSVCIIRDTAGKQFYLFSGVFRYVAGRQPVQAEFGVPNSVPLYRTAMVPVVGYVGSNPAYTYVGWGQVQPNGKIRIHGPKPGWTYTVTISGQIPAAG
jgi:hypothetical protein